MRLSEYNWLVFVHLLAVKFIVFFVQNQVDFFLRPQICNTFSYVPNIRNSKPVPIIFVRFLFNIYFWVIHLNEIRGRNKYGGNLDERRMSQIKSSRVY